jgi:hypothetical protein
MNRTRAACRLAFRLYNGAPGPTNQIGRVIKLADHRGLACRLDETAGRFDLGAH